MVAAPTLQWLLAQSVFLRDETILSQLLEESEETFVGLRTPLSLSPPTRIPGRPVLEVVKY